MISLRNADFDDPYGTIGDDPSGTPDGLAAYRQCPHGRGMAYHAVMETPGKTGVDAALTAGRQLGHVHNFRRPVSGCRPHYAVLDVVGLVGGVVGELCIPTPESWAWWVQAVELRATASDCPECEPAAYQATYPLD